MPSNRARTLTRMPWIAALAAIALAGCAAQDPEGYCGDDVPHERGLDIALGGADTTQTYGLDVLADGTAFALTYAGGVEDQAEIDLGDGFTLYGRVGVDPQSSDGPYPSVLSLLIRRPGFEDGFGPETATVTATMQGESVTETFTPVYDIEDPHEGPQCRAEHAKVTMSVPTP